jgi:hypothetical protein
LPAGLSALLSLPIISYSSELGRGVFIDCGELMSGSTLGDSGKRDSEFELTELRNMPKGELREFIAELLIEIENLANIAELPRVENLLRFAINDLHAQPRHRAPRLRRGMHRLI